MKRFMIRVKTHIATSVWFVPALFLAGAVILSSCVELLDAHLGQRWAEAFFTGGADGARTVLSVIAASVMTFAGLNFSVTMLVLQLASNQFSPSVLPTFLRDRGTQAVFGSFVGTFLFALLGLRIVRSPTDHDPGYVPPLTVWLAVLFAFLCVLVFVYFLHHIAQAIRVVNVLARIGSDARVQLLRLYPQGIGEPAAWSEIPKDEAQLIVRHDGPPGVVVVVDEDGLWRAACEASADVRMVPMVGDFVPHGGTLFTVHRAKEQVNAGLLIDAVVIGDERDSEQDLAYSMRQLVDIALRALSPAINDPTTAVRALDQLHDILRRLATRQFPDPHRVSDEGGARLVLPRPSWSRYIALSIDEILETAPGNHRIRARIADLLRDVAHIASSDRRSLVLARLAELGAGPDDSTPAASEQA